MDTNNPGLIGLLASKMGYLNQRQSVLAENVANANTPGFKAKDLEPFTFGAALNKAFGMTVTDSKHILPALMSGVNAKTVNSKSFETLPTGNSVDLEQQMMQVSETSVNYQMVTSLYKQITSWFRIAVKGSDMAKDHSQLTRIFTISGSALQAQDQRMKIIAENLANASTAPAAPGQKPYQRQIISFKNEFDKALGAYKVQVAGVLKDQSAFLKKFDPSNPAADDKGYIETPNVNPLTETMDMMEAQHAYQANLNVIDAARGMVLNTINLLNTQ